MRQWFIEILIRALRLDPPGKQVISKQEEDLLLSALWENPAFRKYVAERDSKLIHAMAGGEGMGPEPREAYLLHTGQRVENLLLARDAKAAYNRQIQAIKLAQAQDKKS